LIEGSADAPWDESVIARYFAVDNPGEKYEGGGGGLYLNIPKRPTRRWFRICEFKKNPDGTKAIKIVRVRWAAVPAGAPKLINPDNYTWDGHDRPLKYIIAPGAEPRDITRAGVLEARNTGRLPADPKSPQVIQVVPNGDAKGDFAFAPGDEIEQAIGGDPWVPIPLRIRTFDALPSTMPNPAINIENFGPLGRQQGILFSGGGKALAEMKNRKDGQPIYGNAIEFDATVGAGLRFRAQVRDAAMMMEQRGDNFQPLSWLHHDSAETASFGVDPKSGRFAFQGGSAVDLGAAPIAKAGGLSATDVPARNLRGIGVKVPKGARSLDVKFERAEADGDYAMTVQPSWFTMDRTTAKAAQGFTVEFSEPAPENAVIDWVMVR
jgi:hypothetical protein